MTKLNLDDLMDPPAPRARIEEQASVEEFTTRLMPSRQPVREGQLNIRARLDTLEAFKRVCRVERRTYGDMLERMMKAYGPPKE